MPERRKSKRAETLRVGTLTIGESAEQVVIQNLSSGGAMVDGKTEIPEATVLIFDCAETGAVPARVAWTIGTRSGLTFDDAISLDVQTIKAAEQAA